jgi:hypothetical protein
VSLRAAFAEASEGPNGEKLVKRSDASETDGALPFTGSWETAVDPLASRAIAKGLTDPESVNVVDMWPQIPTEATKWVWKHKALDVDELTPSTLSHAMQHGLLGVAFLPAKVSSKAVKAAVHKTLIAALQQRTASRKVLVAQDVSEEQLPELFNHVTFFTVNSATHPEWSDEMGMADQLALPNFVVIDQHRKIIYEDEALKAQLKAAWYGEAAAGAAADEAAVRSIFTLLARIDDKTAPKRFMTQMAWAAFLLLELPYMTRAQEMLGVSATEFVLVFGVVIVLSIVLIAAIMAPAPDHAKYEAEYKRLQELQRQQQRPAAAGAGKAQGTVVAKAAQVELLRRRAQEADAKAE